MNGVDRKLINTTTKAYNIDIEDNQGVHDKQSTEMKDIIEVSTCQTISIRFKTRTTGSLSHLYEGEES